MDRLTTMLLASLGGGILLGTGLRLGEALTAGATAPNGSSSQDRAAQRVLRRIRHIEARLEQAEAGRGREGEGRQSGHLRTLKAQVAMLEREIAAQEGAGDTPVAADAGPFAETNANAAAESIQARVIDRITKLEEATASQSGALRDLQACSIKTEKSVQLLIAGLDRWLSAQPGSGQREE